MDFSFYPPRLSCPCLIIYYSIMFLHRHKHIYSFNSSAYIIENLILNALMLYPKWLNIAKNKSSINWSKQVCISLSQWSSMHASDFIFYQNDEGNKCAIKWSPYSMNEPKVGLRSISCFNVPLWLFMSRIMKWLQVILCKEIQLQNWNILVFFLYMTLCKYKNTSHVK